MVSASERGRSDSRQAAAARKTQSLLEVLGYCWHHPSLLGIELAWRWLFGLPALLLIYLVGSRLLASVDLATTGVYELSLTDPLKASVALSEAERLLLPHILSAMLWLAPMLAIGWAVASGIGRNQLLRRYDRSLPNWPLTMMVLQLLRIAGLGASFVAWFLAVRWAGRVALGAPDLGAGADALNAGAEPNLVLYLALLIAISLAAFTLWALLSWVFSVAPLVALAERQTIAGSLVSSLRLGRLSSKLAEVNLVLGIIKLALIVLAMVFSATPLPFANALGGTMLYVWWGVVTLLYLAASDFFQVARLIAFLDLLPSRSRQVPIE